jgi:hypothetical protein
MAGGSKQSEELCGVFYLFHHPPAVQEHFSSAKDASAEVSTPRRRQPARIAVIMTQFLENYKGKIQQIIRA